MFSEATMNSCWGRSNAYNVMGFGSALHEGGGVKFTF